MCVHGRTARTHTPPLKTRTATHAMGLQSPSCLLLLLVLLVPAAPQCSIDPCPEEVDCTACLDGTYVADPEDCRGFYVCTSENPTSVPFDCPDGQVFNATSHLCQEGDECEECTVGPPTGNCNYECVADGPPLISSLIDCHSYYECDGDIVAGSGICEEPTPFFNGDECQTDERLCCHCHPYCTMDDVGTIVADPLDCRGYYLCEDSGEVPTVSGTCPDGENFDSFIRDCSASAPCSTQASCLNVVRPDGCIDPFTCVSVGFFARCPNQCTPDYYHCTAVTGTFQGVESCGVGTVFHPDNHNCVSPANCPY